MERCNHCNGLMQKIVYADTMQAKRKCFDCGREEDVLNMPKMQEEVKL